MMLSDSPISSLLSSFVRLASHGLILALSTFALTPNAQADDQTRAKELWKLCSSCHGKDGSGVEQYHAPSIAGLPAWYIEAQLVKFKTGVRGGTHPGDITGMRMRPITRMLSDDDIKLMTAFVAAMPRPTTPDTIKGSLVKGEQTFGTCKACHGPNAEGNQQLFAPPLVGQNDWYMLTQLTHFKKGYRGYSAEADVNGTTMSGIASALSEEQIKDVVTYINALKPTK